MNTNNPYNNSYSLPTPPTQQQLENGVYPPAPPIIKTQLERGKISVIDVNKLTPIKFLKELLLYRINESKSLPINAVLSSSSNIEYILDQANDIISNINNAKITYTPTTPTAATISESSGIGSIIDNASELISQLSRPIESTPVISSTATSSAATISESSDILDRANELISQLSRPIEYTPAISTPAIISQSSDVGSILDNASKLIPEVSIPIEYTPTASIIATVSDSNISSIIDNASELIETIKYYPPKPKWYEPSDKYKDRSILNINSSMIKSLNKQLVMIKEENGNTIIKDIYK